MRPLWSVIFQAYPMEGELFLNSLSFFPPVVLEPFFFVQLHSTLIQSLLRGNQSRWVVLGRQVKIEKKNSACLSKRRGHLLCSHHIQKSIKKVVVLSPCSRVAKIHLPQPTSELPLCLRYPSLRNLLFLLLFSVWFLWACHPRPWLVQETASH